MQLNKILHGKMTSHISKICFSRFTMSPYYAEKEIKTSFDHTILYS